MTMEQISVSLKEYFSPFCPAKQKLLPRVYVINFRRILSTTLQALPPIPEINERSFLRLSRSLRLLSSCRTSRITFIGKPNSFAKLLNWGSGGEVFFMMTVKIWRLSRSEAFIIFTLLLKESMRRMIDSKITTGTVKKKEKNKKKKK